MKKKCGHEDVCIECTREEIAALEKKLDALKGKLSNKQLGSVGDPFTQLPLDQQRIFTPHFQSYNHPQY